MGMKYIDTARVPVLKMVRTLLGIGFGYFSRKQGNELLREHESKY